MNFDNPRIKEPILGEWRVDKYIGSGQYGKVYKVHNSRREQAAIKIISMPNNDIMKACEDLYGSQDELADYMLEIVQKFTNEVESMKLLRRESKNIIEIYDNRALQDDSGVYWDIVIVMEYAQPLKEHMNTAGMKTDDIISLGIDMANALDACAKYNIIHRDIKEDNIFYGTDGRYKIGDFGVANMAASQEHHTKGIGTMNYMAPEVSSGTSYDNRADIYSLGIVLYKLFNGGKLPFVSSTVRGSDANRKRMSGERLPAPEFAPPEFARIILKCCEFKPEDRYGSAAEVANELEMLRKTMQVFDLTRPVVTPRKPNTQGLGQQPASGGSSSGVVLNKENTAGNQTSGININIDNKTSKTIPAWQTYDPTLGNRTAGGKTEASFANNNIDRGDFTSGFVPGGETTAPASDMNAGMQNGRGNDLNTTGSSTVDIIRSFIDKNGSNSPILKKLMEKNKLLENEKQQLLHSKRSNKVKKTVIGILTGAVIAALVGVLLVIILSTSYFANEGDYHRIYSHSILKGDRLFDATSAAYVSKDGEYLYFSEISADDSTESTYRLCRLNIKTKEKEVVNDENSHFDVVIGDYIYFTSGPKNQEFLYRKPKDGSGEKDLLLDSSCYDLKAEGKTLVFKVLNMNGQERKVNTNTIGSDGKIE